MQTTQERMYYAAEGRAAETNLQFLKLVKDGITREDLASCIHRRPALWGRFEGWLEKLPSRTQHTVKPARLQFISTYRGVASYEVLSGPMAGKRIRARYLSEDFYLADWNGGSGWNYTEEMYRREIVAAAGIVDYLCEPVTADVLAAINTDPDFVARRDSRFAGRFETARYLVGIGWKRLQASMPS